MADYPQQSTYDTIKNRGRDLDAQIDAADVPRSQPTSTPTVPIQPSPQTDNKLPQTEGIFHRIVRGFTGG